LSRRPERCGSSAHPVANGTKKICYDGYRFPPEIIQQAIWLYLRFTLSLRDVEDLLAERGITVSYESIRRWVIYFGPMIASDLRKHRPKPHTSWHLDEVYLKIDEDLRHPAFSRSSFSNVTRPFEVLPDCCHDASRCARAGLGMERKTSLPWNISRDSCYQMSNRFAWAWMPTELGIPVVLVYLGFVGADEMIDKGKPFADAAAWEALVTSHSAALFPSDVWGHETRALVPLIRSVRQALYSQT
jgi:hypothetical protein